MCVTLWKNLEDLPWACGKTKESLFISSVRRVYDGNIEFGDELPLQCEICAQREHRVPAASLHCRTSQPSH